MKKPFKKVTALVLSILWVLLCVISCITAYAYTVITVDITTDNIGNIFFDSDEINFNISYTSSNTSNVNANYTINYLVPSEVTTDKLVRIQKMSKSFSGTVAANKSLTDTLTFNAGKYGLYELKVTANGNTATAAFSKSVKSKNVNKKIGVNLHYQDRTADVDKLMNLAKKSGMGNVRDQMGWNWLEQWKDSTRTETKKALTPEAEAFFDAAEKYDMDVLALLVTSNNCYDVRDKITDWDKDDTLTSSHYLRESTIYEYKEFLNWFLTNDKFKNTVNAVEVLNEPDLHWNLDGYTLTDSDEDRQKRADAYARQIKTVYGVVKDLKNKGIADYDVGVLSLSNIYNTNSFDLADRVFKNLNDGTADAPYFDALTLHPYEVASWDDLEDGVFGKNATRKTQSQANNINYWRALMGSDIDYYTYDNGTDKKLKTVAQGKVTGNTYDFGISDDKGIYHTEFGYSSAVPYDKNNPDSGIPEVNDGMCVGSELKQAYLLMRGLSVIRANNFNDVIQIYEMCCGDVSDKKEPNFGIVNNDSDKNGNTPYSAKYAYLALANYNNLTADKTSCELLSDDYKFDAVYKNERKAVHMLWTTKTSGDVIKKELNNPVYYDLFGNLIDTSDVLDSNGNIRLTENPIYAVENLKVPYTETGIIDYANNFEEYSGTNTDLILPDGFGLSPEINKDSAKRIFAEQETETGTNDNMIKVSAWAPANIMFDKIVTDGKLYASFDMKTTNKDLTVFYYRNGNNQVVNDIFSGDDKSKLDLSTLTSYSDTADGQWHKYEFVADFSNKTCRVFVDGKRFDRSGCGGIKGFRIQGNDALIDNLTVNHMIDGSEVPVRMLGEATQSGTDAIISVSFSKYTSANITSDWFVVKNKTTGNIVNVNSSNMTITKSRAGYKLTISGLDVGTYTLSLNPSKINTVFSGGVAEDVIDFAVGGTEDTPVIVSIKATSYNLSDTELLTNQSMIELPEETSEITVKFNSELSDADGVILKEKSSGKIINAAKSLSENKKSVLLDLTSADNLEFGKDLVLSTDKEKLSFKNGKSLSENRNISFKINNNRNINIEEVWLYKATNPKEVYTYTNGVKGALACTIPSVVYPVLDLNNVTDTGEETRVVIKGYNSTNSEIPIFAAISSYVPNGEYSGMIKNLACDSEKVIPKGEFEIVLNCDITQNTAKSDEYKIYLWNKSDLTPYIVPIEFVFVD